MNNHTITLAGLEFDLVIVRDGPQTRATIYPKLSPVDDNQDEWSADYPIDVDRLALFVHLDHRFERLTLPIDIVERLHDFRCQLQEIGAIFEDQLLLLTDVCTALGLDDDNIRRVLGDELFESLNTIAYCIVEPEPA